MEQREVIPLTSVNKDIEITAFEKSKVVIARVKIG